MATLRDLSTPAMLYVLKEMLERSENKALWDRDPLLKGYKKHLKETYDALVASRPTADPTPNDSSLRERLVQLDQRHDLINSTVYRLLGVTAQLLPNAEQKAFFDRLQKQIYPHRLRVNTFRRSEEVAEALRLQKQLKDSVEARKALDGLELVCGKERFCVGKLLEELFDVAAQMNDGLRELAGLPPESQAQIDTEARKSFMAWMSRFQDAARLLCERIRMLCLCYSRPSKRSYARWMRPTPQTHSLRTHQRPSMLERSASCVSFVWDCLFVGTLEGDFFVERLVLFCRGSFSFRFVADCPERLFGGLDYASRLSQGSVFVWRG